MWQPLFEIACVAGIRIRGTAHNTTYHVDTWALRDMRRATGAPLRLRGLNAVRQL